MNADLIAFINEFPEEPARFPPAVAALVDLEPPPIPVVLPVGAAPPALVVPVPTAAADVD